MTTQHTSTPKRRKVSGASYVKAVEQCEQLRKQRDALVAALHEAVGHMKHMQQFIPAGYKVCIGPEYVTGVARCIDESTAALAQVAP